MKRVGVLAAVLFALGASGAQAHTVIVSPNPAYQQWVDEAKVPTPDVTVTVNGEWCPQETPWEGQAPCTIGSTIWMGLEPDRRLFLHELGHVFDTFALDDTERARFLAILHDPRPWVSPPNSPNEKFAEAYQWCARFISLPPWGRRRGQWGYVYGYVPTVRLHRQVCRLIRQD